MFNFQRLYCIIKSKYKPKSIFDHITKRYTYIKIKYVEGVTSYILD